MHITVLGATGGTGGHVLDQALTAGHRAAAVVRDPGRLPLSHERLDVVHMPVPDHERLRDLLAETDAVVSGLAATAKHGFPATTWTNAVLTALDGDHGTRLVMVSAAPVAPRTPGSSLGYRTMMRLIGRVFADAYRDLGRMEAALADSGTAWTVVRPPRLTDGPLTGGYRTQIGHNVPSGYEISRADLAHALLRALDDPEALRQPVGVAR